MILPVGNPLFEHTNLSLMDVQVLMDNLANNKFSGYLALEHDRKLRGGFFYSHGIIKNAFEIDEKDHIKLIKNQRLLNKMKVRPYVISTYVLSPKIVDVLSSVYVYEYVYRDYDIKKKDFKKLLSSIEIDAVSGFAVIYVQGESRELIFSHGKVVTDSFANEYGRILCQPEQFTAFVSRVMNDGARMSLFGEKSDNIETKEIAARQALENEKELRVKIMGGLIKSNDAIKVEENFYKDWGIKPSATIQVEIEAPDGMVYVVKCSSGKNLAGNVMIPSALLKKFNLTESSIINLKPQI